MNYKFINMEYLDSVSGGDASIISELVGMFKEQAAEMYNEMKTLLAQKNYIQLGLLAHKAKSSVAIMGMTELAQLLKTFELQTREQKEIQLYDTYVERFKADTDVAVKELEDVVIKRS